MIDPKTLAFVEFNDVAHRQLGYSREEFSKLTIHHIEVKETQDEVKAHVAKMLIDGAAEFETEHCTKMGEVRNVLVTTKTVDFAGKKFFISIHHDITEIRRIQDALKKSEAQYRQLVNLAQEGVWVLDKDYNTIFVNPRIIQIFGYSESEMMRRNLFEFLSNEHVSQARQYFEKDENGFYGHFESEFSRKDGSPVYAMVAASLIKDEQGQKTGTLALIADITERKYMEDQLELYSKSLEELVEQRTKQLAETQAQLVKSERLAAIGELAGMVGHDLRNPLAAIKNAVYFLRKKNSTSMDDKSNQMLTIIDRSIEHANKIIADLLEFSREIRLEFEECSPKSLVDYVLLSTLPPKRIKIVNHAESFPTIWVDANKIERVFTNIIKNAVDAMPDGGTLEICSRQNGENVDFSFSDTGIGISAETFEKLFTPLFTTKSQGMGFGLAICKRIVEAHRGRILVESIPNKKTTFIISLPIEEQMEIRKISNEQIYSF